MSPELDSVFTNLKSIIDKQYGKESGLLTKLNDEACIVDPSDIISSGSIGLDYALGIGGYRKGRIIELFGAPSCGKTTACLHAIANAQAQGESCLFIDAEHALDPLYARSLGVDFDKLYLSQPDYGEQALSILDLVLKDAKVKLAVVDSVAALIPKAELEGTMEDQQVGLQARMMAKAMRKITAEAYKSNTLVIFVNQTRSQIGGMSMGSTTSGGVALKFHASARVEFTRIGATTSGSKYESSGNKTRARVVKNKMAPPFKTAEFPITFGIGIDKVEEIINLAAEDGIIKKAGAWLKYEEQNFQGTKGMKEFLKENPEVISKIELELRENRGLV